MKLLILNLRYVLKFLNQVYHSLKLRGNLNKFITVCDQLLLPEGLYHPMMSILIVWLNIKGYVLYTILSSKVELSCLNNELTYYI